jgi:hypothetical protein
LPLQYEDGRYAVNDGSARPEAVKVDILLLSDGRYRVNWVRATFKEQPDGQATGEVIETYGLPGWLLFERDQHRLWQLVEDGVGNFD